MSRSITSMAGAWLTLLLVLLVLIYSLYYICVLYPALRCDDNYDTENEAVDSLTYGENPLSSLLLTNFFLEPSLLFIFLNFLKPLFLIIGLIFSALLSSFLDVEPQEWSPSECFFSRRISERMKVLPISTLSLIS